MEIHIFATDNEDGQDWKHMDWFYKLTKMIDGDFIRFGKLYRNRSSASRAGNKIGKSIHWYPF